MSKFRADQSVGAIKSSYEGAADVAMLTVSDLDSVYNVITLTIPATASAAQGDFALFYDSVNGKFAVWLDIDAAGTEPAGPIYSAAAVKIMAGIATGDTAPQAAAKVKTALENNATFVENFSVSINGAVLTITDLYTNAHNTPVVKNSSEAGDGSITAATTTSGAAPSKCGKYFSAYLDGGEHYFWVSSNSTGADPAASGTGHEIALVGNETNTQYLDAIVSEVNGVVASSCERDGSVIKILGADNSNVADTTAGDTGWALNIQAQGNASIISPGMSPSSVLVNPATIT